MKYLLTAFVFLMLGAYCFTLKGKLRYYEAFVEENGICTGCTPYVGPGMSFDSSLIIFREGNPVYYPSHGVFLPLIAGEVEVGGYALHKGKKVFLEEVSPAGKALIFYTEQDSAWVKYADLSPYPHID